MYIQFMVTLCHLYILQMSCYFSFPPRDLRGSIQRMATSVGKRCLPSESPEGHMLFECYY